MDQPIKSEVLSTADYVTVLSVSGAANKIVKRDKSGKVTKKAGPPIAEATGVTVRIPTQADMVALQKDIGSHENQVLSLSYVPGTEPEADKQVGEPFTFISKKRMGEALGVDPNTGEGLETILGWHEVNGERCICRLKVNMVQSSWCLIDIDATEGMPEHLAELNGAGRREKLADVIPGFDACGVVVLPSTTGRVLVDGTPMNATGEHLYFQLQNPADLERFGAVLLQHSTLKGYGFQKPIHDKETKETIGTRSWSIADPTTFTHGRLVFDGSPKVIGKGLSIAGAVIEVIEGGRLDTNALADLSDAEARAYCARTGQSVQKERRTIASMGADGAVTARTVDVYITVDNTKLKADTVIETEAGKLTLLEYWQSDAGHTRCQTPFRASSTENGILNRHKDGTPFVFDNGLRVRYVLSKVELKSGERIVCAAKLKALHDLIAKAKFDTELADALPLAEAFAKINFLSAVDKGRAEKLAAKVLQCGVKEFRLDVKQIQKSAKDAQDNQVQPEGTTLVVMHKPLSVVRTMIEKNFTTSKLATLRRCKDDFYTFNGVCYQAKSDAAMRSKLYEFLEGGVIKDASGFIAVNPKSQSVSEVMDALKAEAHLDDELSPPCWIDGKDDNPPAEELLICKNGLLHMPTRELSPLNAGFFSLNALTYDYDADAPQPEAFNSFLDDLVGDDQDAEDLLQEMFGYILSGASSLQKILMIIGPKRSGKGTLGRVLVELVGPANVCSPRLESLGRQFGLQPMIGKILAYMSDVRLEGMAKQQTIVENLLRVSGEDDVNVERKGKEDWFGRLAARFLMLSNMVPRIADPSGALSGRFTMLVLKNSFFGREDPNLTEKLLAELPGIQLWALDGWDRLQKNGRFTVPASSAEELGLLERLTSPVLAFMDDKCTIEADAEVSVDDLFRNWKYWRDGENRNYPGTKESFCRDVRAAVPDVKKIRKREGDDRRYFYRGIGLNNDNSVVVMPAVSVHADSMDLPNTKP